MSVNRRSNRLAQELSAPAATDSWQLDRVSLIEVVSAQWEREKPDVDLPTFLFGMYLTRIGTLLEQSFHRVCMDRFGLSSSDMRVLFALRRGGAPYAMRPTDLFRALLITSGAVTKKIDRLAALNLVERRPDPTHAGGFLVHLTEVGLKTADAAVDQLANHSVLGRVTADTPESELEQCTRLILRSLIFLERTLGR